LSTVYVLRLYNLHISPGVEFGDGWELHPWPGLA